MKQKPESLPGQGLPAREETRPTPGLTPVVLGMDAVGALVVLAMVVLVNVDVFGRWLLDAPLAGTLELTEMGIVAIVYFQIAHAIGARRLTRSDTFLNFLDSRGKRRIRLTLSVFFNLAGTLVFATMAYGQFPRLIKAWSDGYYKGNVGIFTAPTWPLEAIMLAGASLAALQFAILTLRRVREFSHHQVSG